MNQSLMPQDPFGFEIDLVDRDGLDKSFTKWSGIKSWMLGIQIMIIIVIKAIKMFQNS